jgi:hypothetical protein
MRNSPITHIKNQAVFVALLTAVVTMAATSAAAGTFTRIDVPVAGSTVPIAINTAGDVVGSYSVTASSGSQGFLYSSGQFTTINVPGTVATGLNGINDLGQIVGFYCAVTCVHPTGFVFDGQTFTDIQYPGARRLRMQPGSIIQVRSSAMRESPSSTHFF